MTIMNDTECRYLIQRRFDGDLDPHEEQSLDDFIDRSESCAKFEHQLDQMIQGAEELSLPEDFAPPNPEALAKVIQQQLPQQKAGFFSAIAAMFGGGGGGNATRSKGKGKKGKKSDPDTAFPHRSKKPRGQKVEMDPDDAAISQRLKSLQKSTQQEEYVDSRETQSTTSSLGQKLGFEAGPLMQEESSQLTLAESIKRKIAESQGLSTDEDHGHDPYAQDPYAQPLAPEPEAQEQWSSPMSLPGQTQPPQPSQSGPIDSPVGVMQTPAQPQRQSGIPTPHPGSSIGLAPPGQEGAPSDSWDTRPPKGSKPGSEDPDWGPPPVHGTWDEPQSAGAAQASGAWGQQSSTGPVQSQTGSGWGAAPSSGSSANQGGGSWGQPAANQAEQSTSQGLPQSTGSWGQPAAQSSDSNWSTAQQQAPTESTSPNTSGSWATPPSGKTETGWGANAASSTASGAWSTPAKSGDSWGTAASQAASPGADASGSWASQQTPSTTTSQTGDQGWSSAPSTADSGWGSPQQTQTPAPEAQPVANPAAGGWGTPQTQAQPESSTDAWGQPAGSPSGGGGWGVPGQAEPAQVQPVPEQKPDLGSGGGWGTPQAQAQPDSSSWGGAAPQTTGETAWGAAPPSGDPIAAEAGSPGFGTGQNQAQSGWGTGAGTDSGSAWGTPGQTDTGASAQPATAGGGWGAAPTGTPAAGGWGTAGDAQAAQTADPGGAGGWSMAAPGQDANAQELSGRKSSWSIPAEQLETGSFKAWDEGGNPADTLGAGAPATEAGRFDTPIQERASSPMQDDPQSHWDVPIQEKMKQQAAVAPAQPEAAPAPAASNWGAEPAKASGLGDPAQSHWDLPIQEKIKQTGQPLEAAPQAPFSQPPAFGQAPSPVPPAVAPAMPEPVSSPDAAAIGGQSGLFGQPLDDRAIDQIFSTNLGVPEDTTPGAATAPPSPVAAEAPMPATPAPDQGAWGNAAPAAPPAMGAPDQGAWGSAPAAPPSMGAPDQGAWGTPATPAPDQGAWGAAPAPPAMPASDQGAWGAAPAPPPAMPAPDQGAWGNAAPAAPDQGIWGNAAPAAPAAPAAWGQPASQDFAPPAGMMPPEAPVEASAPKISSLPAKNGSELGSDAANQRTSGIFNLDDRAVDQIFEKMGVPESPQSQPAAEVAAMPPQPQAPASMPVQAPQPEVPQMAPAPPAAPVPGPTAASGLFNINDSDMDKMFDKVLATPGAASDAMSSPVQQAAPDPQMSTGGWGAPSGMAAIGAHTPPAPPAGIMPPEMPMAPPAPPMPAPPMPAMPTSGLPPVPAQAPPAMAQAPTMAQAMPQTPPPKVEGIGKLDASVDTNDSGSGRIAAIGKFLLDQKDLEKLGKITEADQGEVKMRILTMEASADLQSLLKEIGAQEKVIGSVIVGHDGLLIANTMPEEVDAESMGVWALGVYMNTEHVTKKMGHDRVHQVVSRTPRGYVVIADFGGGLLVTITDGTETTTLIPLMRKITDLVS